MRKARVLIVDDAVVVRRIVTDVLSADPELEVIGTAANGKIGLQKIQHMNPDVVTLDIEMPEMDGLETLAEIRKLYPRLPVIMFSTLTQRGASATLEALALGASDYVTKPANVGSVAAARQSLRDQMIPKIKALFERSNAIASVKPALISAPAAVHPGAPITPSKNALINVVAIGISTGGPNALCDIMPEIPADFPVPIVIVQHMPPMFTKLLAERLDSRCQIRVHEGVAGESIQPGHAYIAPGNYHMVIKRKSTEVVLDTNQDAPENSCRPAVDVLFRSVNATYGAGSLGVIMTGMGQDGLRGCESIRNSGGYVIAQDEESSVVWGMPGFVARAGLANIVSPLRQIAMEIQMRVQQGRSGRNRNSLVTAAIK